MLTTTQGYEKPETTDAPSALRTAIGYNADRLNERLGMGGSSLVATEQQATTTSFALLTTPDRVQNLVVPAGGAVLEVSYSARWGRLAADGAWSLGSAPTAAIFVGGTQIVAQGDTLADPIVAQAEGRIDTGVTSAILTGNAFNPLSSAAHGLIGGPALGANAPSALPSTPRALAHHNQPSATPPSYGTPGPCRIYCPTPGTYDVDIRFKFQASATVLRVRDRILLVRVLPFAS